jgi:hypothetical protein
MREMELEPVHRALRALLDPALVTALADASGDGDNDPTAVLEEADRRIAPFLEEARKFLHRRVAVAGPASEAPGAVTSAVADFGRRVRALLRIAALEREFESPWPAEARAVLPAADSPRAPATPATGAAAVGADATARASGSPRAARPPGKAAWGTVLAWAAVEAVGHLGEPSGPVQAGARLFDTLRLRGPLAETFQTLGLEGEERWRAAARVRVAFAEAQRVAAQPAGSVARMPGPRLDPDVAWLIGVHEAEGTVYYVKEPFERLVWWLALPSLLSLAALPLDRDAVRAVERDILTRTRAAEQAGYRLDRV